jgi:hypothetical protein
MRPPIFATAAAIVGLAGAGTLLARGASVCDLDQVCCVEGHICCVVEGASCCVRDLAPSKRWSITNFVDTIMVDRTLLSGPVLIVHDEEKMARGEPCTTFYRFDPATGPKEALVSFHCKPHRAEPVSKATFRTSTTDTGIKRLVEYQLEGETEAHGVPR